MADGTQDWSPVLVGDPSGMKSVLLRLGPELVLDNGFQRNYPREAAALSGLDGREVAGPRACVTDSSGRVVASVRRHVEGVRLDVLLAMRPRGLDVQSATVVAQDVLRGVRLLHTCGVAHRAVTPDRVIVQPDGVCVLADTGLVPREEPDDLFAALSGDLRGAAEVFAACVKLPDSLNTVPLPGPSNPALPRDSQADGAQSIDPQSIDPQSMDPQSADRAQAAAQAADRAESGAEAVPRRIYEVLAAERPASRWTDDWVNALLAPLDELEAAAGDCFDPGWDARGRDRLASAVESLMSGRDRDQDQDRGAVFAAEGWDGAGLDAAGFAAPGFAAAGVNAADFDPADFDPTATRARPPYAQPDAGAPAFLPHGAPIRPAATTRLRPGRRNDGRFKPARTGAGLSRDVDAGDQPDPVREWLLTRGSVILAEEGVADSPRPRARRALDHRSTRYVLPVAGLTLIFGALVLIHATTGPTASQSNGGSQPVPPFPPLPGTISGMPRPSTSGGAITIFVPVANGSSVSPQPTSTPTPSSPVATVSSTTASPTPTETIIVITPIGGGGSGGGSGGGGGGGGGSGSGGHGGGGHGGGGHGGGR